MSDDYTLFLESINLIFLKAMGSGDYRLALQAKALEAKCRGYLMSKSKRNTKELDTSIDGLELLLENLNREIQLYNKKS